MLAGLGAVAVAVWLLAPQFFLAALPVLIVLVCPLSMLAMAWMMRGEMGGAGPRTAADRRGELDRTGDPAEPHRA